MRWGSHYHRRVPAGRGYPPAGALARPPAQGRILHQPRLLSPASRRLAPGAAPSPLSESSLWRDYSAVAGNRVGLMISSIGWIGPLGQPPQHPAAGSPIGQAPARAGSPLRSRRRQAAHFSRSQSPGLVLGQVAAEEKSNEIRAIPALLEVPELRRTVMAVDAAGCQQEMAAKLVAKGADYIPAVKGNHPTRYEQVTSYFERVAESGQIEDLAQHLKEERGHSRRETRRTIVVPAPEELRRLPGWATVCTVVMVIRESLHEAGGKLTWEIRHYVSSATEQVRVIAYAVR